MSIPVIDLEDFPGQQRKLLEACEGWGCFRVVNHKISDTLLSEMKTVVRSLLDLPVEIKRRNTDVIAGSGYVGPTKVNPLYEALGLYDIGSSEAVEDFSTQLDASPQQSGMYDECGDASTWCFENTYVTFGGDLKIFDGTSGGALENLASPLVATWRFLCFFIDWRLVRGACDNAECLVAAEKRWPNGNTRHSWAAMVARSGVANRGTPSFSRGSRRRNHYTQPPKKANPCDGYSYSRQICVAEAYAVCEGLVLTQQFRPDRQ
ncbi:hypothetical protein HHK36_031363 [Tetracentron sinense]|uniref:Non-haem dioxygenase N-terminal domain-containing protein n=1 Tax=Tetracentron sinense TaxID=13715 RepID=A0A834YB28_TETSI|nr:hypothetical protein HHK36_031363 [Tetracentron sinense]